MHKKWSFWSSISSVNVTVKEILTSKNTLTFSLSASGFCYKSKNIGSTTDIVFRPIINLKMGPLF